MLRQLSFIFLLLIIGGSLTLVGSASSQQFQLNTNISPLHTDGKYIKDISGNIIFLRGIDKTGFLDSPDGWWQPEGSSSYLDGLGTWDPNAVKAHLNAMQSWDLSVIRIVIGINYWITNDTNYRQNLRNTIIWAGERGMYVILAPWAVVPADGQDRMPFPPYTLHPEIMTSEQDFVDFWASVATEMKDLPNILYELYNEPIGFGGHNNVTEQKIWFNVAQRCVDVIRAISDQIIIIQWGHGIVSGLADLNWVQTYPINGTNIVYSTHIYRFHGAFGSDNPYNYTTIKQRMMDCKVNWVGETLNKTLIIGEIGADLWETGEELEHELEYFNNTLTILNEWDLGYAVWEWFESGIRRWGILDPVFPYVPPPNDVGQMLIDAIKVGSTIRDIIPPIANAGPNQTVDEDTLVTFNGSASWDNVGITNYTWTFTDRKPEILTGVNPTYTFETPSIYFVTLNVSDAAGNWNTDNTTITVVDVTPPMADAGPNQTVNEDTSVTLDGSSSYDNVAIIDYTWTLKDITPKTLTGVKPTYNFTNPGNYTVTLNVTDAEGNWAIDTVVIIVLDITSPTANAGLNQSIFQGMTVTFNGSGSTDNVGIVSHVWAFLDVTLQTLMDINPNYTYNNVGNFEVTLNVTDAAGNWNTDVMWVYVSADNFKPFIGAPFHDPEIPDENQTVTVSVNVTDTESGVREVILSYSINEGATWTNVTMIKTAGAYKGEIFGFPAETNVWYKIIAYDKANNSAVEDNGGAYHVYTVIPEFQRIIILIFIITILTAVILTKTRKQLNPSFLKEDRFGV